MEYVRPKSIDNLLWLRRLHSSRHRRPLCQDPQPEHTARARLKVQEPVEKHEPDHRQRDPLLPDALHNQPLRAAAQGPAVSEVRVVKTTMKNGVVYYDRYFLATIMSS